MVGGGTLTIDISHTAFARNDAGRPAEVPPGDYVRLAVSDTGTGMDEPTRERMFEPFFTTKKAGSGTGLGMATVFGIVQQSNGRIVVRSERGAGTEVSIYLPAAALSAAASPEPESAGTQALPAQAQAGAGSDPSITVLLVEDEPTLRQVLTAMLESAGYAVTAAPDVEHALRVVEQGARRPDVLLTDVVMPRASGAQLAEELRRRIPRLKVLFMSGYADPRVDAEALSRTGASFLRKPFSAEALFEAIDGMFSDRVPGRPSPPS
jgi:CheY-like chemotaxis protein